MNERFRASGKMSPREGYEITYYSDEDIIEHICDMLMRDDWTPEFTVQGIAAIIRRRKPADDEALSF